jgi:hypothetical protein
MNHLRDCDDLALGVAEHDEVARDDLARVHVREHGLIQRVDPGRMVSMKARLLTLYSRLT